MTDKPDVDDLITAGEREDRAIAINDHIYMVRDVSNSYMVLTDEGNVLINTGTSYMAAKKKAAYAAVSPADIRKVIVTQSHGDHYGGLKTLLPPNAELIVSARYPGGVAERQSLSGFYVPRTNKLWHHVIGTKMDRQVSKPRPVIKPSVLVEDTYRFTLGGRRFEAFVLPGGEALDGLGIWMPDEGVAFIGNLLGPAYLNVPNLNTVRGDRPRSAERYIESVSRVRALKPKLLITGHGEPIHGSDKIEADLTRMINAMQSVLDQTIEGMNAGKDVHTLMREIRIPETWALAEQYGKTSWNVRSIWEQLSGWFHYDSTTALYTTPGKEVARDIAELSGGVEKIVARAKELLASGRPIHALHLLDIARDAAPGFKSAIAARVEAHRYLLNNGGSVNLYEKLWLVSEIDTDEKFLRGE